MTIQELNGLLNEGGATFKDGAVVRYDRGFQVSILFQTVYYDNNYYDRERLLEAINDNKLPDGGIWFNKKTNKIEVDLLTVNISDFDYAIRLAKHFEQKAIYNWYHGVSIDIIQD